MKLIIKILPLFLYVNAYAQMGSIQFIENKGQWDHNIAFKAKIPAGNLYLENNKLTYQFYNENDMARLHELHHDVIQAPTKEDFLLHLHSFNVEFLNAKTPSFSAENPSSDYVNYFLGNDKNKWAANVKKYDQIAYQKVYDNINLKFYLQEGHLKYDFIVAPKGDVKDIQLKYNGLDKIRLEKGTLQLSTSINEIIEKAPYAYQIINGVEKEVKCKFHLKEGVVSFKFPKGYDKTKELIIDPTLIFASYSGSQIDNWGFTSTFDEAGHLYGGGVSFGVGYPTTIGAYQINFNGGNNAVSNGTYLNGTDITITKFSSDGSSLIYSTYLGGSENESPHSLVVNHNDELLILGSTSSPDFPVSINGYDTTYNGGTSYLGTIPSYTNGSDIVISKLNSSGSALLGSTYFGGSGNDGLNTSPAVNKNYGDDFRGEIIIDQNDNVYVASSTLSTDFPVSGGAIQSTLSGTQDGCAFKLSSDLSTLNWSTYLGGDSTDAAFSIQLDYNGNVLITGGTTSANFSTTAGALHPTLQGATDGWITKLDNNATAILASTYIGTPDFDQCYFVQLDTGNNVYVVGQTEGLYPITPSVYNNFNSGQFLHKLSPDLSTTVFSTTFGTSSGAIDIALSAFLVNVCNNIFVSGWGGGTNLSHVPSSTTNGLPITGNAIQSTTDGADYYLILLSEDASSLMFSTYFGGNSSQDHVDGGTSRFDKKGIVYQAVCASCFNATSDFPTTPGAWSNTDSSSNCNLGVFKMDLSQLTADAEVYTTPSYCVGESVPFQNLSNGGISYYWEFGDGDTSTLFEPIHVYDTAGTYNVMLVSLDSISCILRDTDYVDVYIGSPPVAIVTPGEGICKGDSVQLNISGGLYNVWTPNYNISNDTSDSPIVWPDTTTTYTIITYDTCGTDTSQITVPVYEKNITLTTDTSICLGQSVSLAATGGSSYLWSPAGSLNNPNIPNPVATPTSHIVYNVTITNSNLCFWDTSLTVYVDTFPPNISVSPNTTICVGDSIEIYAIAERYFSWSPSAALTNPNDSSTLAFPTQLTNFIVTVTNGCGNANANVTVDVHPITANIVNDTSVCIGNYASLWARGGASYLWYTSSGSISTDSSLSQIIYSPTTYFVDVTDVNSCITTMSVFVDTLNNPYLELGENIEAEWGSITTLNPITNGVNFWWSPSGGLSCTNCSNPTVTAQESVTYYLTVKSSNGCFNYDTINISFNGSIYVPNSFTPNGNGGNDIFYVYGKDIIEFDLTIFDRWGEQIFHSTNLDFGWDGTYRGTIAKTETYVWKVKYKDVLGETGTLFGTVTLIR